MRVLLGVALIIAAVVILLIIVVVPVLPLFEENATIDAYLQTMLCAPNQSIIREQYSGPSSEGGTSYSMNVYCTDRELVRDDVTGKWVIVGAVAFVIPLLLGILLLVIRSPRRMIQDELFGTSDDWGSTVGTSGTTRTVQTPGMTVTTFNSGPINMDQPLEIKEGVVRFGGIEMKVPGLTADRVQALQNQMQAHNVFGAMSGGDELSLADKLKQLQEARDAGLLSADEYDRLRQQILDAGI